MRVPTLILEAVTKEVIDAINRYSTDLNAFEGGIGELFVEIGSYQLRLKIERD